MVGLEKMITYAKIWPRMVNPSDIAGNVEEEEARKLKLQHKNKSDNYPSIPGNTQPILTSMTLRILSCPKKVMKYMGSSSKLLAQPSKWSRCLLRLDLQYRTWNIWFTHTYTHSHACRHTHTHTNTHACTHTHTHARIHAHTHTHKWASVCARSQTRRHTCIQTHIHRHTHTTTHTHRHIPSLSLCNTEHETHDSAWCVIPRTLLYRRSSWTRSTGITMAHDTGFAIGLFTPNF